MTRAVTILDVADEAQVSKSTVSLVLQGSPLIRDETAQRVRDAARRLGYVYNRRAAELRRQGTNVVGVVINDLMNPFFAEVLVALERKLVEAGYIVLMAHTHESVERQRAVIQSMREQHAAGLVLCPALGTPASVVKQIQAAGMPLVVMIRTLGKGAYDFVGSDNERGIHDATAHLVASGHRRIAFVGGIEGVVVDQRLRGWRAALEAHGIRPEPSWVVPSKPTREGGYEAAREVLKRKPRFTAAVCYNDIVAFGALWALGEQGLRAGTDFAITGSDNVLDAAHSNPPLTTIDVRPAELGERAAATLLTRMREPEHPKQTYIGEPRLVTRQSG